MFTLRLEGITTSDGKSILSPIAFSLEEGKSLSLVGESGSGKTTLAYAILGLLDPSLKVNGLEVSLGEENISSLKEKEKRDRRGKNWVYLPQNGIAFLNPATSIRVQLGEALKKWGVKKGDFEAVEASLLRKVGFKDPYPILDKYPYELSGGMAERVVFALSLSPLAELVIADEPTNGLDPKNIDIFTELFSKHFSSSTRLIITHDIDYASLSDYILVLNKGVVMEYGPSKQVLENPKSPYTKALIEATPRHGLKGYVQIRAPSPSCPFYGFCPLAKEECLKEELDKRQDGRYWRCIQP